MKKSMMLLIVIISLVFIVSLNIDAQLTCGEELTCNMPGYGLSIRNNGGHGILGYSRTYNGKGILGRSDSLKGIGVFGLNPRGSGRTFGVYGSTNSPDGHSIHGVNENGGYAGYFEGNTEVTGVLYLGGKGYFDGGAVVTGDIEIVNGSIIGDYIPRVVEVPASSAPPIPAGLKITCQPVSTICPVVKRAGYTYWAYSYIDNRLAMNIVAYRDIDNSIASQTNKDGARYVSSISVNTSTRVITFTGQAGNTVTMTYTEPWLLVP